MNLETNTTSPGSRQSAVRAGFALGLDIGGSSVKWAVVRTGGASAASVVAHGVDALASQRSIENVVQTIFTRHRAAALEVGGFDSIGVGLPGIFDSATGRPVLLPNFPREWIGHPLQATIENRLGQPVRLINDAKAFSVAESTVGAGSAFNTVACVVLGTGVGGGIVIGGALWTGSGSAGEFGHLTVDLDGPLCGCGNTGCVEAYAGSDAIARAAGCLSAQDAFQAAADGDERAIDAIRRAVTALGAGMANVFVTIAPDVFVVGGGIAGAGTQLIQPLIAEIRKRVKTAPLDEIRVFEASLGRTAGAVGAAIISASPPSVDEDDGHHFTG